MSDTTYYIQPGHSVTGAKGSRKPLPPGSEVTTKMIAPKDIKRLVKKGVLGLHKPGAPLPDERLADDPNPGGEVPRDLETTGPRVAGEGGEGDEDTNMEGEGLSAPTPDPLSGQLSGIPGTQGAPPPAPGPKAGATVAGAGDSTPPPPPPAGAGDTE